jgi:hypothetical protein
MNSRINELSKGEKADSGPNKYNLRSKKKEGNSDVPDPSPREEKPAKDATNKNKEKKAQNPSPIPKDPVPEVREVLKSLSSFIFEHEIQKIRIPVPLSELIKHKDFKKSLSKML